MPNLNKVMLIGHVGADPDVKTTEKGIKVAEFSLATTDKFKDQKRTEWHRLVAFGQKAELIEQYVKKGDPLYIEGGLRYNKFEGRTSTSIQVEKIQFLKIKEKEVKEDEG